MRSSWFYRCRSARETRRSCRAGPGCRSRRLRVCPRNSSTSPRRRWRENCGRVRSWKPHLDRLAGMESRRLGRSRPCLDQEHELGAVFPAVDHGGRVLGLRGNVADRSGYGLSAAVASHAHRLPDSYRAEDFFRNKEANLDMRGRQERHHRGAGWHPFPLDIKRVGDLTVPRCAQGFLLEPPLGLREGFPRGGGNGLRGANLVRTRGEPSSGKLGLQFAHSSAVTITSRTCRVGGLLRDESRAYELFLPRQIALGERDSLRLVRAGRGPPRFPRGACP